MGSSREALVKVLIQLINLNRHNKTVRPSLKTLLLSDEGRADMLLPKRGQARRRPPASI